MDTSKCKDCEIELVYSHSSLDCDNHLLNIVQKCPQCGEWYEADKISIVKIEGVN